MIGEPVEHSLWFSGDSEGQKAKAETLIRLKFGEHAWKFGPIEFVELSPEDDRVPEPPQHWHNENPKILLGTAVIIGTPQVYAKLSDDLEDEDLHKLRTATRRAAGKHLSDV